MEQILEYKNKELLRKDFHTKVFRKIVFKDPLTKEDRLIFSKWIKNFNPDMSLFEFYRRKEILFEIVKYLGNSELCLNEKIRWIYASKIDYLLKVIYFYKLLEYKGKNKKGEDIKGLTFYKGLLDFNKRPHPPFSPKEKREWQDNFWTNKKNPQYIKHAIAYNFGLDIDGKDIEDSYEDAKKVFNFFKKFNIKFSVWSSGKKGFHFIIPYKEFENLVKPFDVDFTISFCQSLMLDLVKHLRLKKVDSTIYSSSRYLKCCFTLDSRNGFVILPLSDEEFLDFLNNKEKYLSQEYCLSLKDLGNRGAYFMPSNPKGFSNMIKFLEENIK